MDVDIAGEDRLNAVVTAFEEIALYSMEASMELPVFLQAIGRRLIELLEISRCTVYLRRDAGMFACHAGWSAAGDMGANVPRLVTGHDTLTHEVGAAGRQLMAKEAGN